MKIIVPTDFSDSAKTAAMYAIDLAKEVQAEIKLIHAYTPAPVVHEGVYFNATLVNAAQDQMDELIQELTSLTGEETSVQIDGEVKVGFAFDVIKLLANEDPSAWIIMGNSTSDWAKKAFGSTSTALAKKGKNPTIIVPPDVKYQPIYKIAFCTDDVELDMLGLPELLAMANLNNAEIHILHVSEEGDEYDEQELLSRLNEKYVADLVWVSILDGENKVESVNQYCEDNEIEMLALVRRNLGALADLFHRSFTRQLVISSTIPLLIAHK